MDDLLDDVPAQMEWVQGGACDWVIIGPKSRPCAHQTLKTSIESYTMAAPVIVADVAWIELDVVGAGDGGELQFQRALGQLDLPGFVLHLELQAGRGVVWGCSFRPASATHHVWLAHACPLPTASARLFNAGTVDLSKQSQNKRLLASPRWAVEERVGAVVLGYLWRKRIQEAEFTSHDDCQSCSWLQGPDLSGSFGHLPSTMTVSSP